LAQYGECSSDHFRDSEKVNLKHRPQSLRGSIGKSTERPHSGIVHDKIEPAIRLACHLNRSRTRWFARNISNERRGLITVSTKFGC
jgi:hypothetical protein